MAEYVLKKDILNYLEKKSSIEISTNSVLCKDISRAIDVLYCDIDNMPAADVQPANQWISVKERQPDKDDLYLVAVENEICVYMDIADYSNNQWHKHDEVIYWQPLPELPKEG